MVVSVEFLKRRQSEFKAPVISYLKEGKSIRSIRYEQYLNGIVTDVAALISLETDLTTITHLSALRNFYSNLAGWMHIVNKPAAGGDSDIYRGIQQYFLITA